MSWDELSWVDLAMLGVLLLSIVVGLVRGVVFELLSLAGWFAAWFGGNWLEPWIAPHLPAWSGSAAGPADSALNRGVAFACGFIAVLIVWGLATRLVALLVKATPLRPLDRLLGAAFGVVRGLVVLLVVATLVSWTPAATSPAWRESVGAAWMQASLQRLLPLFPVRSAPPPSSGPAEVVRREPPAAMTNRS